MKSAKKWSNMLGGIKGGNKIPERLDLIREIQVDALKHAAKMAREYGSHFMDEGAVKSSCRQVSDEIIAFTKSL